jgi:hypothetical protein
MACFQFPKSLPSLAVGAVCIFSTPQAVVSTPLDEAVSVLEQWVETERLISQAQAEWEANRAAMENLIEVYGHEIAALEEIIAAAEQDTSAAEARRAELTGQDSAVKEIETAVAAGLVEAEKAIKQLRPLLPQPLQEELGPLFSTLPQNPEDSRMAIGQRVQPIVAILTQIQKFNQVVTVVEGFREFEEGRTVQTEKVHLGLGAAFYVDQANEHAGFAVLGPEGWEWQDDSSLIPAVRSLVNIYRGMQQARYVELPVDIQ